MHTLDTAQPYGVHGAQLILRPSRSRHNRCSTSRVARTASETRQRWHKYSKVESMYAQLGIGSVCRYTRIPSYVDGGASAVALTRLPAAESKHAQGQQTSLPSAYIAACMHCIALCSLFLLFAIERYLGVYQDVIHTL